MKLKLLTAALVVLLASSLPSSAASEDKDAVPDVVVPNVLHVDAVTGVSSFEDKHHALTDVEVSGVASAASGFDLVAPSGIVVFQNQSSTYAGVVSFWQQALLPGSYAVYGPGPDGARVLLVSFDVSPFEPTSGTSSMQCLLVNSLDWLRFNVNPVCVPPVTLPGVPSVPDVGLCRGGGNYGVIIGAKPYCVQGSVPTLPPPPPIHAPNVDLCSGKPGVVVDGKSYCVNVPQPPPGPSLGWCADGKEGVVVNGNTATCVNPPTLGSCPDGKTGYTVNGNTATCIGASATLGSCPDGKTGYTVNGNTLTCVFFQPGGVCYGSPSVADCAVDKACDPAVDVCNLGYGCATYPDACTPEASPPDADAPDPGDPNPPNPVECGDAGAVDVTNKVSETTVWTPTLIIHSPYGGSAEAVGSWSKSKGVFIAEHGQSSTIISQENEGTVNGETKGLFLVATWGYYEVVHKDRCGQTIGSREYYAKIIDTKPNGFEEHKGFPLWGPDKTTDRDDEESISGCTVASGKCYDSMHFANRYRVREASWDATMTELNPGVGSRTYQAGGGTVSFSLRGSRVSASLSVSLVADKAEEVYYRYHMPRGNVWSSDALGTNGGSALAFCDDWRNGHC